MEHTQCSASGACECDWRYLPPDCSQPLYANDVQVWHVFIYSVVSVHGALTLLALLGIWAKYRIFRRQVAAPQAGIVSVTGVTSAPVSVPNC